MSRTLALFALAALLAGCTRYGTNAQGGPFARNKIKSNPTAAIPQGPPANNSPLVLAGPTTPERPPAGRPPEPITLAGGFSSEVNSGTELSGDAQIIKRPRPEPQPSQFPSPFAPKDPPPANPPGSPGAPKSQPEPTAPGSPAAPASPTGEVRKIVQLAAERWSKVDTYETVITRRELTPKNKINSEVLLFQFRKEPMAVFTRNTGDTGKGREMIYNPSKYGDKMHVMLGKGDSGLAPAGFMAPPISPDDDRVKEKARYSIRESGFGMAITRVADWLTKCETGKLPAGALTFHGLVTRPESAHQLVGISLKLRPGDDPMLPTGGVRQWFFDPKPDSPGYGLPVIITAHDAKGGEAEYYLFEKIRIPAGLTDADFNPERLGKKR